MLAESQQTSVVAVGEVKSVTPSLPTLPSEDALRPATQTGAIGLILPPHDIRGIADKTAQFVARNGIIFEQRVMENEKGNTKFSFLKEDSPYHAYYKSRVRDFREGGNSVAVFKPPEKKQSVKEAPTIPRVLHKPEPDRYSVTVPEGLTALDLDIVKLSAQFVARNGKSFLTALAGREHANPQFNFLKPTHSMFSFFTALCDAYSKVLMPPKDTMHKLTKEKCDQQAVLERYLHRLEWEQAREREEKEAADAAERERIAMQLIDWHDFVIVETIDFHQDEDADLPLPMTLKDVVALNKAHVYQHEQAASATPVVALPEMVMEDVEMDEEEANLVAAATDEPAELRVVGTEVVEAETDVPIKVIKNYKRMDKKLLSQNDPSACVVSPITGELVKISEMENHMRVSLIDPRWKEQRDAMMDKIRETTKADDGEIGKNLLALAKTRPDIFGSTQEEVSQAVKVSIREKMMSGLHRPVVWDGVTQSGQILETQLKAIQESKMQEDIKESSSVSYLQATPAPPTITQRPVMAAPGIQPGVLLRPSIPPTAMTAMRPPPQPMVSSVRPMMGQTGHPSIPIGMPGQPPMPEEPEPKRQRMEFVLQPEEEFMARMGGGPSKVRVQCPAIEGNEKLFGQLLEVEVESLMDSIGRVKSRLADVIGLPANKQKLSRDGVGFLKDEFSLAHYNISEDVFVTLGIKERGRRKK